MPHTIPFSLRLLHVGAVTSSLLFALLCTLYSAAPVAAQSVASVTATFVVNTLDDEDDGECDVDHCSLREALSAANADDDFDTITFADGLSGTIQLVSTLSIGGNLLLDGPGVGNISITPLQTPPLPILSISNADPITVTVRGLTFQGSRSGVTTLQVNRKITATFENTAFIDNQVNSFGGALGILAGSVVTVTESVFTNNRALQGGAILNFGKLTVINTTFDGNRATSFASGGGAIRNEGGSAHIIASTIISSNYAVANVEGGVLVVSGTTFLNNVSSALYNIESYVTVNGSTFTNNSASNGGAIDNGGSSGEDPGGVITITASTFVSNSAFNGGAISNRQNGQISIDTSTFTQNRTTDPTGIYGGAIINEGAVMTITNSTLDDNRAERGAAIANQRSGTLTISNSTISNNYAENRVTGQCGGIMNDGVNSQGQVTLTLRNSTISGNRSDTWGGGICNLTSLATTTVHHSTIVNNRANFDENENDNDIGGGIYDRGGATTLASNIIASNSRGPGNTLDNISVSSVTPGTLTSQGFNLSDNAPVGFGGKDIPNVDPLFAPLGDNGGPTHTHALFESSPAIDAGDNAACPATDQRGITRPQAGNAGSQAVCDIGAVEMDAPLEPGDPDPEGETLFLPALQKATE